jgi:hypothetical protein
MEIEVFRGSENIKDGELFIAKKSSTEGRDKAILTHLPGYDNSSLNEKITDIIYVLKHEGENFSEETINGIHEIIMTRRNVLV